MVGVTVLFQPGWVLRLRKPAGVDPVTGNDAGVNVREVPGRGLVQAPLWTGFSEVTDKALVDERLVMWCPLEGPSVPVDSQAEFVSPSGEVWQAITSGIWRGIPGSSPEYVAVRVRRAEEKDE
ncbi:hypothetical protein CLAC_03440 [Corynebacterium lactis RW2-5]|uniref:Uncharacterized protein n=1 Tax=Corynebacterium lactis RW2-5 TaxID=1408189 RepID=A0A0K2GYR3_9CORY|nr:hypothetical protein [Corynebacterium lactis]ALA66924.1 hypothetical protein CLAC_03440 [Corynebacterium lactis RW2-5]